jgi:hypothetical protein
MFGGTASQPQTIWGSVVGDYENMLLGTEDDDGLSYTIASNRLNAIQWMMPLEVMILGTAGGCWQLMSTSLNEPLTPTNFNIKPTVSHGSSDLQAILTGDVILYVERHGRRVRELAYNFEKGNTGGYVAQDMTILAEHITGDGLIEVDLQQDPDNILWSVREDGALVGLTYERPQDVIGWHLHETDGEIESVAVIPGTGIDEVWLIVNRTIGGDTKRYVELMEYGDSLDALTDAFYVDSGLTYSGVPADEISGLGHLEGKSVQVLADGVVHPVRTVVSGAIRLNANYSKVHVGLGYEARIKTLPIEAGAAEGTAQGKTKRFHQVSLILRDTVGLKIGSSDDDLLDVETGATLYSGTFLTPFPGGYDEYGQILLTHDDPLPATILGIIPRMVTNDA